MSISLLLAGCDLHTFPLSHCSHAPSTPHAVVTVIVRYLLRSAWSRAWLASHARSRTFYTTWYVLSSGLPAHPPTNHVHAPHITTRAPLTPPPTPILPCTITSLLKPNNTSSMRSLIPLHPTASALLIASTLWATLSCAFF